MDKCNVEERKGKPWIIMGVWRLRGYRKGVEKGKCPICGRMENMEHILWECTWTVNIRKEHFKKDWSWLTREAATTKLMSIKGEETIREIGGGI